MFTWGSLLFFFLFFLMLSILSATALLAVATPMSRGFEYLFTKRLVMRRKAYIATLSTLVLTVIVTYVARLFIVVGAEYRHEMLDPFPGGIATLFTLTMVNTMFVLFAIGLAIFRLRKIFMTTEEDTLDPRSNFNAISVLVVVSLFNFFRTFHMILTMY